MNEPALPKIDVIELTDEHIRRSLVGAGKIAPESRVLIVGCPGGLDRSVTAELMQRELERHHPNQGDIIIVDDSSKRGNHTLEEILLRDMPNIAEKRKPFTDFIDNVRTTGTKEAIDVEMPPTVGEAFKVDHMAKPNLKTKSAKQLASLLRRGKWYREDIEAEMKRRGILK